MKPVGEQKGFTIVELLIVVVVIAILAAITIVAFTGIQDRAKQSALQSAVSQAAKKVSVSAVNTSELYPVDKAAFLAATNLADTPSESYEYLSSDDRKAYCVSVSNPVNTNSAHYARTQDSGAAVSGRCTTNLILNPSVETNTSGMGAVYGQGGAAGSVANTTTPFSGSAIYRTTWTTAPTNVTTGGLWAYSNSATGLNAGGKVYTASGYIRNSWAGGTFSLNLVGYTSANAVTGEVYGTAATVPSGAWTRVSVSWTAPANTDYFVARIRQGGGTLPSISSTMDVDGFMLTEGSVLYGYGGAGIPNWVSKTGAANAISFGPALVP